MCPSRVFSLVAPSFSHRFRRGLRSTSRPDAIRPTPSSLASALPIIPRGIGILSPAVLALSDRLG